MGVSTRLSQAFDWKHLYIALSASYTQQNGSMMLEDEVTDSRANNTSMSLQINMEPARFMNFNARSHATRGRSQLTYEGAQQTITSWSFEHSLDVNILFSEAWRLQWTNRLTHDNRTDLVTYFADASLTYTWKRWMFQLVGHNLLNKTKVSAIYLSDRMRQSAVSDLRPRELMAKVNFSF